MMRLRRVAAAPLLLLAFIGAIGLIKSLAHRIDDPVGNGISCAVLVLVTVGGIFLLLRPDIERLHGLAFAHVRHWFYTNPLGQAIALYILAAVLMAVYSEGQIMLFILPLEGFPILLIVSGIVRIIRGAREI